MAQSILVTGGCGFIGSNFLHRWVEEHPADSVVNFDALTYAGNPTNVAALEGKTQYRFVKGDITNAAMVEKAMKDIEVVVHFAAESHVDRSIEGPQVFLHTNVIGTGVLLEAARRRDVKRFHHVSTDEVFGDLPLDSSTKFNEHTAYHPHSPYAASKAGSDHIVRAYGRTYGLKFTVTNGSNNFGPYQHPEKVMPRFITNLILGQKMPVYGTGKNVRDWLHVRDYCAAIDLVLAKGHLGETYCVGGGIEVDTTTLARKIASTFGKGDDVIEFVKDRPGHDLRYAIDSSKIRNELGWKPAHPFEASLKQTVDWYKANEAWWRPLRTDLAAKKTG
ncbi:MAG TPA: dTDP-glucose 4,6-dehydratase [Candidatus Thermoplasmatota archaeon]